MYGHTRFGAMYLHAWTEQPSAEGASVPAYADVMYQCACLSLRMPAAFTEQADTRMPLRRHLLRF